MNVRITQIDGKLPNIALMRLSSWHKSNGHNVCFEKSITKGIFEPDYDIVYGSAIFSTSEKKITAFKENFPNAIIGGTGSGNSQKIEDLIGGYQNLDYSIYPNIDYSIGFSQRGCRLRCKFCVVPQKEGKNKKESSISEIWAQNPRNTKKKILLLDNDFFGQPNWQEVGREIIEGKYKVCFSQGINIRLIDEEGAFYLSKMKFMDDSFSKKRIYTAWDNKRDEEIFMKGINLLLNVGIKPSEIMVYFLCNYWEKGLTNDVWDRFNKMKEIGLLPYPMVFEKWNASNELQKFQEWVIRGGYRVVEFSQFMYESEKQYFRRTNEKSLRLFNI